METLKPVTHTRWDELPLDHVNPTFDRKLVSGEVLHLPPNVPHRAEAQDDVFVVDVFSPPRHDWVNKTDAYLRK